MILTKGYRVITVESLVKKKCLLFLGHPVETALGEHIKGLSLMSLALEQTLYYKYRQKYMARYILLVNDK